MIEATRRLAAIMSADVAGYSRLMGEDEGGTISALDECFPVIRRHFETYNSRLVETADDSVLAAFESVVEAVQCAIAVQSGLAELNAQRSEDRRMLFRVGVN